MTAEHIIATCWRCGLKALRRTLVFDGQYRNRLVHPECRDEVHPQERPPDTPVDAIALAGGSSVEPVGSIELSVVMNNGGAKLSWLNKLTPPKGTIVAFRVDRALLVNPGDTPVFAPVTTLSVTVTADFVRSEPNSYVDAAILEGATYAWRIVGLCSSGAEYESNIVSVLASPVPTTPVLQVNAAGSRSDVWWSAATISAPHTITQYKLYRSLEGGPYQLVLTTAGTSYTDTLQFSKTYSYYVVAIASNGAMSAVSNIVSCVGHRDGIWFINGSPAYITVTEGTAPRVHPQGKALYLNRYNFTTGMVYQFYIGNDGRLTAMSPATVANGTGASGGLTFNKKATFAYSPGNNDEAVSKVFQFNVAPDGRLTPMSPASLNSGGNNPGSLLYAYDEKYLYTSNSGLNGSTFPTADNKIGIFDIASDGKLTLRQSFVTISSPRILAILEEGNKHFLYVVSATTSPPVIGMYNIESDGSLTAMSPATITSGIASACNGFYLDKQNNFLYVYHVNNSLSVYAVNSDGTLAFVRNTAGLLAPVLWHPFESYAYSRLSSLTSLSFFRQTGNGTFAALNPASLSLGVAIDGGLAITPDGNWGFAMCRTTNRLYQFYLN